MNYAVLPPELNSLRMFTGAGSAPMLAAAVAWDGLAAELGSAASSFGSVTSDLASQAWQGPAAAAMAAAAAPYAGWLSAAAGQIRPDLPRRRPAGLRRHPRPSGNSEIGRHALAETGERASRARFRPANRRPEFTFGAHRRLFQQGGQALQQPRQRLAGRLADADRRAAGQRRGLGIDFDHGSAARQRQVG